MDAQKYYDRKLEKNSDSEIRSAMERSGKWTPEQLQGIVSATLPVQSNAIPVASTPSPLRAWTTQKFPAQAEYAKRIQKYVGNDSEKAKFLLKTQNQPSGWDPARLVEAYPNDPNMPASLQAGQLNPNDQEAQAWVAARHYDRGETFINRMASGGGDPRESNEWLNNPGKRAAMRHAYFLGGEKGVSDAIGHGGQQYLQWMHQNTNLPVQEHINAMAALQSQYADFPTNLRPSPVVPPPVVSQEKDLIPPVVTQKTEERDPIPEDALGKTPKWEGWKIAGERADKLLTTMLNVRGPLHEWASRKMAEEETRPLWQTKRRLSDLGVEGLRHPFAQFARAFNDMLLIPGAVTAEKEPGLAKRLHERIENKIQQIDIDPQDATMADDVLGAIGTMAAFFIPSTLAAKGTLALAKGGPQAMRLAGFLSRSGVQVFPAALMESAGESGRAYQDILAQGGDAEAARWTATKLFGVNITANAMLNKLSGIFDALPREARQQGFTTLDEATSWLANNPGLGGRAARAAIEGVQEMQQNVAGALARERNVDVANMFYEGGVGSIAAAIFGLRGRGGRPIEEILREGKEQGTLLATPEVAEAGGEIAGEVDLTPEVTEKETDVTPEMEAIEKTDVTPEMEAIEKTDVTPEEITAAGGEIAEEADLTSEEMTEAEEKSEKGSGFSVTVKLDRKPDSKKDRYAKNLYPDLGFQQFWDLVDEGWDIRGGAIWTGGPADPDVTAHLETDSTGKERLVVTETPSLELPTPLRETRTKKEPVLLDEATATARFEARRNAGQMLKNSLGVFRRGHPRVREAYELPPMTSEETEAYQLAQNVLYTYDKKILKQHKAELEAWLTQEGGWTSPEIESLHVRAGEAVPVRIPYNWRRERMGRRKTMEAIEEVDTEGDVGSIGFGDRSPSQRTEVTEISAEHPEISKSGAPYSLLNVQGLLEETARTLGVLPRDIKPQDPATGPRGVTGGEARLEERGPVVDRAQMLIQDMKKTLGTMPSEEELEARKVKPSKPVTSPKEYAETHPEVLAGADPPRVVEAMELEDILQHENLDALVKRAEDARVHIADAMVPVHRSREALETAAAEDVSLSPVRADDPSRRTGRTNVPSRETEVDIPSSERGPFVAAEQDVELPAGLEVAKPIRIHIPRPASYEGLTPLETEKREKIGRANIARREDARQAERQQRLKDPRDAVQESESEAAKIIRQRLLASNRAHYMYEGEQRKATEEEERRARQGEGKERSTAFKYEVNIPTKGLRVKYPPYTPEAMARRKAEQRATARLGKYSSYTEKLMSPSTSDEPEIPYRRAVRDQKILKPSDATALIRNTKAGSLDPEVEKLLKEHVQLTNVTRKDMKERVRLEYVLAADPNNVANQEALRKIIDAQTLSPEAQAELDALVERIGATIEENQKTTGANAGDSIVLPSVGSRHRKDITNRLIDAWSAPYRKRGSTHEEQREAARNRYRKEQREAARRGADAKAAAAAEALAKAKQAPILSPTLEEEKDPIPESALKQSDRERKEKRNEKDRARRAAGKKAPEVTVRKHTAAAAWVESTGTRRTPAVWYFLVDGVEVARWQKGGELIDPKTNKVLPINQPRSREHAKELIAGYFQVAAEKEAKSEKGVEGQSWVPAGAKIIERPPKDLTDPAVVSSIADLIVKRRRLGKTFEETVDLLMDPDAGLMRQYTQDEVRSTVALLARKSGVRPVRPTAVVSKKTKTRRRKADIPIKETSDVATGDTLRTVDLTTIVPKHIQQGARDLKIETAGNLESLDVDMVELYASLDKKKYPMPGTPEARKAQLKAWASQK